jgi:hypothetical protein
MILRAIQTFIKDPAPVDDAAQAVSGLNILDGVVRATQPIRSPVRGVGCVAFFYRSFLFIPSGRSEAPPGVHKIKQAEAYAPFILEMNGGSVNVSPSKPGSFTQRDHLNLQERYGKRFQGVEEVVLPGARVRVRGKLKVQNGEKTLILKELSVLDKQAAPAGMSGDRKKRRKNGKSK